MAVLEARLAGAFQGGSEGRAAIPLAAAKDAEKSVGTGKNLSRSVEFEDEGIVMGAQLPAANGIAALPSEESAPWPGSADEASFLAEQQAQGVVPPAATTGPAGEEVDSSPLPSLDELVQRIPAEARVALDDLFRAKFTGVRRVSKKSLKT